MANVYVTAALNLAFQKYASPPTPITPPSPTLGPVGGLNLGRAPAPRRGIELPISRTATSPTVAPRASLATPTRTPAITGLPTSVPTAPGTFVAPTTNAAIEMPGQPGTFNTDATPNFNFPGPFAQRPSSSAIPTTDPSVTVGAPAPPMAVNTQGVPQALPTTPTAQTPPVTLGPAAGPFATSPQNTAGNAVTNPITGQSLQPPAPASAQPQVTAPRPEPKPVPETGLAQRTIDPAAVQKTFSPETWNTLTPEQQTTAVTDLTEQLKTGNPDLYRGFQDVQAGKNTPSALRYQEHVRAQVKAMADQQAAAQPEKAADPQGYGEILSDAWSTFQGMPPALQALVGIGLPVGLIGVLSSVFGNGGMGTAALGALGLGAAGLAGAAGGLFGQDAQNFMGDKMVDMGQFLGFIPEGRQDLSQLTAADPVAAALGDSDLGFGSSTEAVKAKLQEASRGKGQLQQLVNMPLPDSLKIRLLMRMDPQNIKTPEDGMRALQNAKTLLAAFDDPNSPLAQKIQQGHVYTQGSDALPQNASWWARRKADGVNLVGQATDAWNALTDWNNYSDVGAWTGTNKPGASASSLDALAPFINSWAVKSALNAMDQKELHDLQEQKAQGVPYRTDDARRAHQLQLRQQAQRPTPSCGPKPVVKRTVIMLCMKSARCWAGYEPVPGKKPYSEDSCRPISKSKSKKKKGTPAKTK